MANIQVFEYQNNKIRTVDVDGEAWFVLKDVCKVLDIADHKVVARRLDEDEVCQTPLTDSMGRQQSTTIINESGLYHVILRSDKPEATPFRRWVTNDVLPAIRKTGSYNAPQLTRSQLLATALIAAHEELEEKDKQIAELTPKGIFADAVSASTQSILVGEMAKLLSQNGIQMGQNRLFQWMRENGYLIKRKGAGWNMPTQKSIDMGLFEIKESVHVDGNGCNVITKTPKVTGKAQIYFVNKFMEMCK